MKKTIRSFSIDCKFKQKSEKPQFFSLFYTKKAQYNKKMQ